MISLLIHAVLGIVCIALFFRFNSHTFKSGWQGSRVSLLEGLYYVLGVSSLFIGWYFNTLYMQTYGDEAGWWHFTKMLFTNPAAGSGGQDLLFTNAVLFPLWTIIDGPRRGLKHCWIYFAMSLVTSFGFAMALYLAAQERQVRWNKVNQK